MSMQPTLPQIITTVAFGFGVTVTEVKYGRQHGILIEPADIAAYLAFQLTDLPASEIAAALGGCSEIEVVAAHDDVAARWPGDRSLHELLKNLSIAALAEAKALDTLCLPPSYGLDPVAIAREVHCGRLRPTDLSAIEITAIASGLATLAGYGAAQPKEASNVR